MQRKGLGYGGMKYTGAFLIALLYFVSAGENIEGSDPCGTCHRAVSETKNIVHAALSMGCTACHSAPEVNSMPHKSTVRKSKGLSTTQPELCYGCHDKASFSEKVVHAAVGMGCTGCHNPHSSKEEKLLVSPMPDLCYSCHDKAIFSEKVVHAAIGMGCTGCHNPHSSKEEKLLVSAVPDLCFNCHEKKKFEGENIHAPVTAGCMNCHKPHSGPEEKLLNAKSPDLCFNCHEKKDFTRATLHMPVAMGLCNNCHIPHAGDRFLLQKSTNALCRECHKNQSTGKHITAGFRKGAHPVEGKPDPGRPGKEMSCVSCHAPHSADARKLLLARSICQKCHQY